MYNYPVLCAALVASIVSLRYNVPWRVAFAATDCHPCTAGLALHDPPVLDYGLSRRRDRRWPWEQIAPVIFGSLGGYLISFSGYRWFGTALIVGFSVGLLSSTFAPRRRLAFGLLGNGITIAVCLVSATINNWRQGRPLPAVDDLLYFVAMLGGVVTVPGLAGIAVVAGIAAASRPSV